MAPDSGPESNLSAKDFRGSENCSDGSGWGDLKGTCGRQMGRGAQAAQLGKAGAEAAGGPVSHSELVCRCFLLTHKKQKSKYPGQESPGVLKVINTTSLGLPW